MTEVICEMLQANDDLRSPSTILSLSPQLLFRRVHSHKKLFLLSEKLANVIIANYGATRPALAKDKQKLSNDTTESNGQEAITFTSTGYRSLRELELHVRAMMSSRLKWIHAGAQVLIRQNDSHAGEGHTMGANGWRVAQVRGVNYCDIGFNEGMFLLAQGVCGLRAMFLVCVRMLFVCQEGVSLFVSFMRRRICFVSLAVARILLLSDSRSVCRSDLLAFESNGEVLGLSTCRDPDGFLEGECNASTLCVALFEI